MKPVEGTAAAFPVAREVVGDNAPRGLRRLMFPESWPAELRAAVILAVAIVAIYSGSWAAPIIERPATNEMPTKILFELGQRLGGEDTRPYHLVAMALHLVTAVLLFGLLQQLLARAVKKNAFIPACLGALAWAVHPVLTETVVTPARGDGLLGGFLALASIYGLMHALRSGRQVWKLLAGVVCALCVASWLVLTFLPSNGATPNGHAFVAAVKLAFWPTPLIYDYDAPLAGFRETSLYVPLTVIGALVAFAAAKMGAKRSSWVLAIPIVALGVMARVRTEDYRSSLRLWRDTIAKAPGNARAHRELGRALMAAGRVREAMAHFERALELAPADRTARLDLAAAMMQLGRVADAVGHYERILRDAPDNASAHLELAAALTLLSRRSEADPHYQSAMVLGVSVAEQRRRRGRALAEAGDFETAQSELQASLESEPTPETHIVLGMILSALGRPADGMKQFVAAVELNPNDAGAQAALGDALLEDLRPSEALPHFEAALRLDPSRAALIHAGLGRALVRLGRANEAIEHLEAALELNPENAEARTELDLIRAAVRRHEDKK